MNRFFRKGVELFRSKAKASKPIKEPFRPDFSEDRLISRLRKYYSSPGDRLELTDAVRSDFFRNFVVDDGEVMPLVRQLEARHGVWHQALRRELSRLMHGQLMVYSIPGPSVAKGFHWIPEPDYAKRDILYHVRPHRMAFLPRVMLGSLLGDVDSRDLMGLLSRWTGHVAADESSFAYFSNLVVIQRVLAMSWAFAYVGSKAGERDRRLGLGMLRILEQDIGYLMPRLGSSYSNNHLLADYFFGWYVTRLFPALVESKYRGRNYERRWLDELMLQTLEDGTGFEQSLHYHEFSCEMATAYLLIKRRGDGHVADAIQKRIERMLRFQADLSGSSTAGPAIGNATEDPLFPVYTGAGPLGVAWREIYRSLFDPGIGSADPRMLEVEYAFWMLGGRLKGRELERLSSGLHVAEYRDGGYFAVRDSAMGLRTIFRTGPQQAEEVIGGHAHSDLMTISQYHEGRQILVDPGTFTYRYARLEADAGSKRNWRKYLASAAAHNGLVIDGRDQIGALQGDFRDRAFRVSLQNLSEWKADVGCMIHARSGRDSSFAGYSRTLVQITSEYLLIVDDLPDSFRNRRCWYGFQFAPGLDVELVTSANGRRYIVAASGEEHWFMTGDEGLGEVRLYSGSIQPMAGWVAPAYGKLLPAPHALIKTPAHGLSAFLLSVEDDVQKAPGISSIRCRDGYRMIEVEQGEQIDTLYFSTGGKGQLILHEKIVFRGSMLWLRKVNSAIRKIKVLGGEFLTFRDKSLLEDGRSSIDLNLDPLSS